MVQRVVGMDVRMATALSGAVENVAAFCRLHGLSRQSFYVWRRRLRAEGIEGLQDRSHRPLRPSGLTTTVIEELVVWERKNPPPGGEVGADAIRWRLLRRSDVPAE